MTAQEALVKIRVMLGMNEVNAKTSENTEKQTTIELAEATLVDGTIVKVEGEFEVGKQLMVVTEDAEIPAPEGQHETTDGLLVMVDASGVITDIQEKPVEEASSEEEFTDENKNEVTLSEDFINRIVEVMKPTLDKLNQIEQKLGTLDVEFHAFRDEPAGSKITNNLNELNKRSDDVLQNRYEKLMDIRRDFYNKK